jgi:hypothetical protein
MLIVLENFIDFWRLFFEKGNIRQNIYFLKIATKRKKNKKKRCESTLVPTISILQFSSKANEGPKRGP